MPRLFSELTQEYESLYFKFFPDQAMIFGRADTLLDRFTDYSLDAVSQWQQEEDRFIKELNEIDDKTLNERERVTFQLLKETLDNAKASRICNVHLWNINPLFGWHTYMTQLAELQPVGTAHNRAQAVTRWRSFEQLIDAQIANLKKGLELGFTAPKPAVQRVSGQFTDLITSEVSTSPFYSLVQRAEDESFKAEMSEVIKTIINPALQKYKNYLDQEYLALARTEIGISALPSGVEGYQTKIKESTTLDITAEEIHQLGLKHMQELTKQVAEIGQKLYQTTDMELTFKKAVDDKTHLFANEQELLEYNYAALKRATTEAPQWFDKMPKSEGTIRPYPLYRAKAGAAGEYNPPSEDGKEPGYFYINTYEAEKQHRLDHEGTLFHELIPGHHFQIALQQEDKDIPSLNKYLWNSGYGEGWALYVERLADEMGLYSDDISRLGMLSNECFRTARLVVDTGIHVFGWSRDQAIAYMKTHTASSDVIVEGEVDRYIMMPGQATSYMLGKLTIEELRKLAKSELGDRFDIRQFHNQVLKNGVVTLPMLIVQMDQWIAGLKPQRKQQASLFFFKANVNKVDECLSQSSNSMQM